MVTSARLVGADRRLGDRRAVLIDEVLPDPPRRVALLARCAHVGDQPLADRRLVGTELRRGPCRWFARRRQRRLQRLPHRAAVHAVAARQRADGLAPLAPLTSDMLEQLHPRQLLFLRSGRSCSPEPSVAAGPDEPCRHCWASWAQRLLSPFEEGKRPDQSSVPSPMRGPIESADRSSAQAPIPDITSGPQQAGGAPYPEEAATSALRKRPSLIEASEPRKPSSASRQHCLGVTGSRLAPLAPSGLDSGGRYAVSGICFMVDLGAWSVGGDALRCLGRRGRFLETRATGRRAAATWARHAKEQLQLGEVT